MAASPKTRKQKDTAKKKTVGGVSAFKRARKANQRSHVVRNQARRENAVLAPSVPTLQVGGYFAFQKEDKDDPLLFLPALDYVSGAEVEIIRSRVVLDNMADREIANLTAAVLKLTEEFQSFRDGRFTKFEKKMLRFKKDMAAFEEKTDANFSNLTSSVQSLIDRKP